MTKWRQSQLQRVLDVVAAAGGVGVTRSQVAAALGLATGIYVTDLLRELVAGGYVNEAWDDDRKRPAYVYRLGNVAR